MKKIIENAWSLALGNANAILLRDRDDLTLFDAGFPAKQEVVFDAIEPVAYLWKGDRLLMGGDVFMNMVGFADPVGFEDEALGRQSQRKLATLTFDAVAFGHGGAIRAGASAKVRRKLGL